MLGPHHPEVWHPGFDVSHDAQRSRDLRGLVACILIGVVLCVLSFEAGSLTSSPAVRCAQALER